MYPYYRPQDYYPYRPPRCACPGYCDQPRTTFPTETGLMESLYCKKHACRRLMPQGGVCWNAKYGEDIRLCEEHRLCHAYENGFRCSWEAKIEEGTCYDFCRYHLCQVWNCEKKRKYHEGVLLRFCDNHNCTEDCSRRRRYNEGEWCDRHTCQQSGCSNHAPFHGDDDETESPDRFCNEHRPGTCLSTLCWEAQRRLPDGSIAAFCSWHKCCVAKCGGERRPGQAGCLRHSCQQGSCQELVPSRERYCKRHACLADGCTSRAVTLGRCREHKCKYVSCGGEARGRGYCDEHERGKASGGWKTRFNLGGKDYPTYEDDNDGFCLKMTQPRRGDIPERHCDQPVHPGTNYCPTHLCNIRECQEPKVDAFPYCYLHKCAAPTCTQLRQDSWALDPDNPAQHFCKEHSCAQDSCRRQQSGRFRLCARHGRCYVRGCKEEAAMMSESGTRVACRKHGWGSEGGEVRERRRARDDDSVCGNAGSPCFKGGG